jgi:thiosulfate/3-mercaptopyruvate sulfurtransferase
MAYLDGHIQHAVYAHLEHDLSGPAVTGRGRHPLPTNAVLTATLGRFGIDCAAQVVAYDAAGGSIAARLWWLLRHLGHTQVAVLDGGWTAWLDAGFPVVCGEERNAPRGFQARPDDRWFVGIDQVPSAPLLVDSRDPARYRGDHEPIDKMAGHIPGAVNRFWKQNLDYSGRFLPAEQLRSAFLDLFKGTPSDQAVFYCGSGVTACHNILAVEHAGLPTPRLYAGSWSEWCSNPGRPIGRTS